MDVVLSQLFIGLSVASILLLVALGLTFTFGQMGVINMAHGEFLMAGAYTTYWLQATVGLTTGLSFAVALPLAFLIAGALGLVLEATLIRRLRRRPLDTLLVTWGVSLMLQQLARDLFGASNVQVTAPSLLRGNIEVAGVTMPYTRLATMALVVLALVAIWLYLVRSPAGRRMRAVMQHRDLAAMSGVRTPRVDRVTFFIGSGLAGLAGVALTLFGSIGPTLGTNYLIDAFLVVIVGGLGQLRGAIVAAVALGSINAYVEYGTDASLAKAAVFVLIVAFLQFRPQGLIVQRTRGLA
jgi:urea transport system permease protein